MFERHLTDDVLILLSGGQLRSSASKQAALDHIAQCDDCRLRYKQTNQVRSAWLSISEQGLTNVLRSQTKLTQKRPASEFRFPWAPVSAVLAAPIIILIFLAVPKIVPEAKASDILNHAVLNEIQFHDLRAFQIRIQGITCAAGRGNSWMMPAQQLAPCSATTALLHRTPWGVASPLSARTFSNWRNTLGDHHDTVVKQESFWKISTSSPVGLVREASLSLSAVDYRPFSLDLRFDTQEEITITEGTELPAFANAAPAAHSPVSVLSDDPADVLEVVAWEILQNLNADSGWEANVVRDGGDVQVKALVPNQVRKKEFQTAFRAYPSVKLDVREFQESAGTNDFLAQREFDGDTPALAHDWLERQFPDPEQRSRYANSTVESSKAVLGRAFVLDHLKQRQRTLRQCSCAAKLMKLVRREENLLILAENSLGSAAQVLVGQSHRPASKPLSYEDAKHLDTALGNLLAAASSKNPLTYQENVALVRNLL